MAGTPKAPVLDAKTEKALRTAFTYATQERAPHRFTGTWESWIALPVQARAAHKAHVTMDLRSAEIAAVVAAAAGGSAAA